LIIIQKLLFLLINIPVALIGYSVSVEPEKVLDFSKEAVVDSAKLEEEGGNVEYLTSKSKPTSDKKAKKKYADEWK
jgi:hypothetical protein